MRLYGISILIMSLTLACNDANFGGKSGDKQGSGKVIPATGEKNDKLDALNVSELEKNHPKRDEGGPIAGLKEETANVIDLNCDNQAG